MKRAFSICVFFLGTMAALALPSPASAHLDGEHITVIARTVTERDVDVAPTGRPNAGDYFIFTDKLMKAGEKVGRDTGRCDVIRVTKKSFSMQCSVTLVLTGRGQMTVQGTLRFKRGKNPDPVLAVTGGTGDFADASGEFVLVEGRKGPTRYQIHLAE